MKKAKKSSVWLFVGGGIGILLILVVIALSTEDSEFSLYKNSTYGFTIEYPSDWDVIETGEMPGLAVQFRSPKQHELDIFPENVSIVVQELPPEMLDLETYSKTAVKQLVAVWGNHVKYVEKGRTTFAGRKAYKLVYKGADTEGPTVKLMHIWTIVGFRAYQFNFGSQFSQWDTYIGKVNRMLKSFKLE